jgi:hypothetical protein
MLGQKTVTALLSLKPSGPQSFEDLLGELLSKLTGQPYHLSSSGRQGGVDGVSAAGSVGFEAKRYGEKDLDIPRLLGELDQVKRTRPQIELWIVATTGRLAAQDRKELEDSASGQGIALLALAEGDLGDRFHPIAGLCATQPERVCEVLADPAWREIKKGRKKEAAVPSLAEIRAELHEIAALPEFSGFQAQLREKLGDLPTWKFFIRRHNEQLKRTILEDSKVRLGTEFNRDEVIPRTIKTELDGWLTRVISSSEPHLGAVLGERYDGKTWLVFDWLLERLDSLKIPVFFLGSAQGDVLDSLNEMLVKKVEQSLGHYGRHARALLDRHRRWSAGPTPWCLLILDGLNEYRSPSQPWQRHLSDGFARVETEYRPAVALCTVRTRSWSEFEEQIRRSMKGEVQTFAVGPFDDDEFSEALRRAGKRPDEIAVQPDNALPLLRRPRFFQLVLKHPDRLDDFEIVNEDALYLLDASDKRRRERASYGWTEERFQDVLKNLASKYLAGNHLTHADVLDSVETQNRSDPEGALHDLSSEGVLEKQRGKYSVRPDHFRTGMALNFLDRLGDLSADQQELRERLRDALSSFGDDDIAAACLRRASVFALRSAEPPRDEAIDVLIDEWLRSRNRPPDDFQEIKSLGRLLLRPLLRLAPRTWTRSTGHRGLQELSIVVFSDNLEREKDSIRAAVGLWCHFVPTHGPSFLDDNKPDVEEKVQAALRDEGLMELGLELRGDSGLLELQNVGLYLESLSPGLVAPDDLLAVLATHHIPRFFFSGAGPWIVHQAFASIPREWFEDWVRRAARAPMCRLKQVIYDLLLIVQRSDLADLIPLVQPPPSNEEDRYRHFRTLDRAGYEEIRLTPFEEEEKPIRFVERVRPIVVDPELPPPGVERITAIRQAWREAFAETSLYSSNAYTSEDHLFEKTVAGVSAWMPEEGAAVVCRQIADLPRRFSVGQYWWAHSMRRHAVLVEEEARKHVQAAIDVTSPDSNTTWAQGDLLEALLPGMSPSAYVDAILNHRLECEWDKLYYMAVCLDREGLIEACMSVLNRETTSRERARLYTLLGSLQAFLHSPEQIQTLLDDLDSKDHDLSFGALIAASAADPLMLPEKFREDARQAKQRIDSKRYLRPDRSLPESPEVTLESPILDARTDLQLHEIALDARWQGETHFLTIVDKLLNNRDAEVRARAARLLGWLKGGQERLQTLVQTDASLWVRRIAAQSLGLRRQEEFARYWLERFLRRDLTREQRWGAGQLFLDVADGCCDVWAQRCILEGAPDPRIRGEAVLLLKEAESLFRNSGSGALQRIFLGTQVVDLEAGCHPWRRQRSWHELEQRF